MKCALYGFPKYAIVPFNLAIALRIVGRCMGVLDAPTEQLIVEIFSHELAASIRVDKLGV